MEILKRALGIKGNEEEVWLATKVSASDIAKLPLEDRLGMEWQLAETAACANILGDDGEIEHTIQGEDILALLINPQEVVILNNDGSSWSTTDPGRVEFHTWSLKKETT